MPTEGSLSLYVGIDFFIFIYYSFNKIFCSDSFRISLLPFTPLILTFYSSYPSRLLKFFVLSSTFIELLSCFMGSGLLLFLKQLPIQMMEFYVFIYYLQMAEPLLIINMDFSQKNFKNNFLQKKKQEKKKAEDQLSIKNKTILLQKNIRAFVQRSIHQSMALRNHNIPQSLILEANLASYPVSALSQFYHHTLSQHDYSQALMIKRLVIGCMKISEGWAYLQLATQILCSHEELVELVIGDHKFTNLLQTLLQMEKGSPILNITIRKLVESGKIKCLKVKPLINALVNEYNNNYIDIEGLSSVRLSTQCLCLIMQELSHRNQTKQLTHMLNFQVISKVLIDIISAQSQLNSDNCLISLLECIRILLNQDHEKLILLLTGKNKNLINLMEDEQDLQYCQNKMKQQTQYVQFAQTTLTLLQKIFSTPLTTRLLQSKLGVMQIDQLINEMNTIYESRKIIFIRNILSTDSTLQQSYRERTPIFYEGLKMKLITMDDNQFLNSQLFSSSQWKSIIKFAIIDAFEIIKKTFITQNHKTIKKLVPFMKRNQNEVLLKTISQLVHNLYKKSLRTSKILPEHFVNQDLDKMLNTFTFGVGAKAVESMLKNFPFAFYFESRFNKLRDFIKNDKKNYDRSLFLQQEVDEDLIIPVRRGNQFLDAFQVGMNRDLRKKYKIIFYNDQGLQQQGIDGGGIIKEFINRVLKASFHTNYGLFYENSQNLMIPNPYNHMTKEYEFIGKIVGKAVYQSINIEQKFVEPFLNLLIGRQNTFQDLQYIDQAIYKSLIQIKNMETDLESLQQTFVIFDQLPNGMKKYINLKNPSADPSEKDVVYVTNENKMEFIMNYSDFKCNRQLQEKTRLFRRGFLQVMKAQWLTMFNNEQINLIISGSHANYSIDDLKYNVVFNGYTGKDETILMLWEILRQFGVEEKELFLHFITSCPRPPTLGFSHMKPLICIDKSTQIGNLPTANTCMNVLRLPNYKNKAALKEKLLYSIKAKAGFQFA